VLIGLPSSGVHSNGFSLVRKLLEKEGLAWEDIAPWGDGETVAENLLTPTKIYVKQVVPLMRKQLYHSSAHITGGGLLENLNRSIPKTVNAEITFHPELPPVFQWMRNASGLDTPNMLKTFNCGVGMILIVNEGDVQECLDMLAEGGETGACVMGHLAAGGSGEVLFKTELR
jgi:phosphoribosylaminoimidazole synthetase